jgi:hypothetical protein
MPNIIDISYFQKANELNIPLSVEMPVANPALKTPNSSEYLLNLIGITEKSILLNAFGLSMYNELQLALADIDNPLYANYKKLVEGGEYNDKIWFGLSYENSLLAYRVFELYLYNENQRLAGVGNVQSNPEKAMIITPAYKLANANNKFIQQYQDGYLNEPIIYNGGEFIDWFGFDNDVEVSLYRYLNDNKDAFPLWNVSKFKCYETQNSFGI